MLWCEAKVSKSILYVILYPETAASYSRLCYHRVDAYSVEKCDEWLVAVCVVYEVEAVRVDRALRCAGPTSFFFSTKLNTQSFQYEVDSGNK